MHCNYCVKWGVRKSYANGLPGILVLDQGGGGGLNHHYLIYYSSWKYKAFTKMRNLIRIYARNVSTLLFASPSSFNDHPLLICFWLICFTFTLWNSDCFKVWLIHFYFLRFRVICIYWIQLTPINPHFFPLLKNVIRTIRFTHIR